MPLCGWPSKNRCACLDPPGCDEVDAQTIFFLKRIKKRKRIGPQQAFCMRVLFSLAEAYSCCPAHWPVSKARIVLDSAQQSLRGFVFLSQKTGVEGGST